MLFFLRKLSITVLISAAMLWGGGVCAQTTPQVPIEITSDKLTSNPDEKYAEFSGRVKVLYDTYRIDSSALRIYYEQKKGDDNDNPLAVEGIKKIVAIGNVVITNPEYNINAERAEYDVVTEIATFTGKEVRVQQDKNLLIGSKITLNRSTGRLNVEGQPDQRIKAVFYTDGDMDTVLKP